MIIAIYLVSITAANLLTAAFGPSISVVNSFLLIGLDLTARDKLHDKWKGKMLPVRMGALIVSGSLITWAINQNAGIVGVASVAAFSCSMIADSIAYAVLGKHKKSVMVNGSNIVSSAVDSVVFPVIAFGSVLPWIMFMQFVAKVGGGFVWYMAIRRTRP